MRLYLWACAFLLLTGLAGGALVLAFPVEVYDADGALIGEMPPAFAVSFALAALGAAGLLVGGVLRLLRR
jgi:Ni/Fe-hydrogenase subunit HybB-like protein